ncbi:MAG: S-layer homology domain-containing protein [Oscillospiraceae bacterium]|nr:S-layer homology domain-containing protein [Oscillospiraceae bacterium]
MKRKSLSIFLTLCLILSLLPAVALPASAAEVWGYPADDPGEFTLGVDGTETNSGSDTNPYAISTAQALANLAWRVNNGTNYSGKYFKLTANIVLNDNVLADDGTLNSGSFIEWTPIGGSSSFYGNFDGDIYTISGIYIGSTDAYHGLFGKSSGTLQFVTISDSYICGGNYTGGVVGYNSGSVSNCTNAGNIANAVVISVDTYLGGVVGYNNGSIQNCSNTGSVKGVNTAGSYSKRVGGITGYNSASSSIINCTNGGPVGGYIAGGIAARNYGSISCSSNTEHVVGDNATGGIAGYADGGSIEYCYNAGSVGESSNTVGGIAGSNYATITKCFNTGSISGTSNVGGLVGYYWDGTTRYSYNSGEITASSSVGGLCGHYTTGTMQYCYSTGMISGSSSCGGAIGYNGDSSGTIDNCYYDKQMCGLDSGVGSGTSITGMGLAASAMTGTGMFSNAAYWTIATDMYPRLADPVGITFDMDETDAAMLYALPVFLDSGDTAESVTKNFTVGTLTGASWSMSANSAINFDGNKVNVTKQATETNVTLTVTYNSISRSLGLTVPDGVWDGSTVAIEFSGGTGKSGDPYQISSSEELAYLRYLVNNGELDNVSNGGAAYAGLYYELTSDIYLNEAASNFENWGTSAPSNTWTPIGDSTNKFTGSFNGNDHTVSGIFIKTINNYQGLFGYASASIKHVGVIDSYISGKNFVGGVVGRADSSGLRYCYNAGSIFATIAEKDAFVGGLAGIGSASNCYNTGSVTGGDCAGGILGGNNAPVTDCYNTGSVSGTNAAGGIVGNCRYEVSNCYNTGDVAATKGSVSHNVAVGGIAGVSSGGTYNCYNTGTISGSDSTKINAGGITGECFNTVTNCYNFGNIIGSGTTVRVGGLTGYISAAVSNCYNTGNVTGTGSSDAYVGSISGFIPSGNKVQNCYWMQSATQTVDGSERADADKLAIAAESSGTAENCYTFSGSGTVWTLSNSSYTVTTANGNTASVSENSSLIDALNSWVDKVPYYMWTLAGSATGYPILGALYNPISGTVTIAVTNGSGDTSDQICIDAILTATPDTTPSTNLSYQWQVSANGSSGWINTTGSGNSTSAYTVGSSDAGKYLRVKVASGDAASAVYSEAIQVPGNSSDDGWSSNSTPTLDGTAVYVNGKSYTAGETKHGTNEAGQTQTTVTVDTDRLQQILESQGADATVKVSITTGSAVSSGVLTGQMVKNMEEKSATLVVETGSANYTLPAEQIDIDYIAEQFGEDVELSDIEVEVTISDPDDDTVTIMENSAEEAGFTLVVQPVEFTVSCTYNGETFEVTSYKAYVERTINIPDDVDPNKITTAVVVEVDGSVRHVPTQIIMVDDEYYAVIRSLTNSVYTLINKSVNFMDIAGHWALAAINDIGSRLIVTGYENGNFNPDNSITRAEFATIIVKTLGLEPGTETSGFSDVSGSDWYCGYVEAASNYGLITGYPDGSFGPNDTITREQAATIIARAMVLTNFDSGLTNDEISELLGAFTDSASISSYAESGIAACLKTGIIIGKSNTTISPSADITRAEVAAMIQRLLQKSELI